MFLFGLFSISVVLFVRAAAFPVLYTTSSTTYLDRPDNQSLTIFKPILDPLANYTFNDHQNHWLSNSTTGLQLANQNAGISVGRVVSDNKSFKSLLRGARNYFQGFGKWFTSRSTWLPFICMLPKNWGTDECMHR